MARRDIVQPEGEESPCPSCGTLMKSPSINMVTKKSTVTECSKCGTRRQLMLSDDGLPRMWN